FKTQRLMTDFYWEVLDKIEVQKPGKINTDYSVGFFFVNGGKTFIKGHDNCNTAFEQIRGTTEGVVLKLNNGFANQDQIIQRRIYRTIILAPGDKNAAAITEAVESMMDKLKLDMSFAMPKVKEIK
ncbi:MAG: hypothetical protein PHC61_14875, partial [Chitinivibrionales bacterium]|nr:hypothetical protein [Chitinivibrionales bacterium]